MKLTETLESLEKELKGLQERESGAKADEKQILTEIEELKTEADGAHLKHLIYFLVDSSW